MNEINLPENAVKVLKRIRKKYKVGFEPLRIRDVELKILQVQDLEHLLAGKDPFADVSIFPFWVKLWEASLMLADIMASMPCQPGKTLLELGAGLAAPGLVAAARGYKVTLSDYEPHILDFQRVSAAANGLTEVDFRMIDWKTPPAMPRFDTIIGAEILFRDEFFQPLLNVFNQYLAPQGSIFIAHDARRKSLPKFLDLAQKEYQIAVSARKLKSDDGDLTIIINRLQKK
ncbi:MAG: methyltransferase domain-containing protein [Proteobacteria bacterium]|nr:methyltransferase domain-containing protein [Pseudomonadota bacterium]MBU4297989.1 methyltransferase domain-containing protein [Pseudomonadota bacterium]MCG2749549.1 protein N-lysine methyltransferase family protein [Desulfobulbaceae bacterium]